MKISPFRFYGSLRWQLQLWHGLLLAVVLTGFGWSAWSLQRIGVFHRIDQELEQQSQFTIRSLHPHGPPPPSMGPQGMRPPGPPGLPPPPDIQDSEEDDPLDLGENKRKSIMEDESPIYKVLWGQNGEVIHHSQKVPSSIPYMATTSLEPMMRMRGDYREMITHLPSGESLLVGKNIHEELSSLRQTAWILTGVGGLVLLLSLGTGWFITSSAIRPLISINSTAAKIADGDLSQRIPMPREKSEIADLVRVLNQTFTRLEASFVRQTQFTADASHELRTPISIVLTHTQNALARERTSEEYRESLEACQRAARRMRELTESLLALVRLDHGDQTSARFSCRVDQIVRDAVELLTPLAAEQKISIAVDLEPISCIANPEQLTQVVINLLNNAIRYNSPGGMVIVRTAMQSDCLMISVRDTGRGIAQEDLPHLFERFYRADKARSHIAGAGLGLAISDVIVKAHGGSIVVTSELGVGSLFIVKLPCSA